jgi:hypothetical protein
LSNFDSSARASPNTKLAKPSYDGGSIANIPDTASQILGASFTRPLKHDRIRDLQADHVIVLLLDGLGSRMVSSASERYGLPAYDRICNNALKFEVTSVFPSTTASAMASLHSGLTPQEHGIIGYTMYLRELGLIGQMLRFSPFYGGRSLFDLGLDRRAFLGGETIHEKLGGQRISSTVYSPSYIMDSGLSQITYRGAYVEPHNGVADMIVRVRHNLEAATGRTFHFAYQPSPDTLAHAHGPYAEEYAVELESIFRIVESELFVKLDKKISENVALIISGDHGAVRIEEDGIVDLVAHPELLAMLKLPPTGDSRAPILHVKEGERDRVKQYFEKNFNGLFDVRDSTSLLEEGYFGLGKVRSETFDRIGDLVAIPNSYNAIDYSIADPGHADVPGRHGGLSEEEMNVPCVITKLG